MAQRPQIEVHGLREFRAALRTADGQATKIINEELRGAAEETLQRARSLTPRRTGRLADSLRTYASGNSVGVRTRVPYANVIHWGGTTGHGHSRSHPGATRIKGSMFLNRAVEGQERQLIAALSRALEQVLERLAH